MEELFQAPSIIQKISTMADNSIKIVLETQEVAPEEMTKLFDLKNKLGWFLFKENEIKIEDIKDIPEAKGEFKKSKTPSQKLRNVLWVYWDQQGQKRNFETFRKRQIKIIIDKVKSYLE